MASEPLREFPESLGNFRNRLGDLRNRFGTVSGLCRTVLGMSGAARNLPEPLRRSPERGRWFRTLRNRFRNAGQSPGPLRGSLESLREPPDGFGTSRQTPEPPGNFRNCFGTVSGGCGTASGFAGAALEPLPEFPESLRGSPEGGGASGVSGRGGAGPLRTFWKGSGGPKGASASSGRRSTRSGASTPLRHFPEHFGFFRKRRRSEALRKEPISVPRLFPEHFGSFREPLRISPDLSPALPTRFFPEHFGSSRLPPANPAPGAELGALSPMGVAMFLMGAAIFTGAEGCTGTSFPSQSLPRGHTGPSPFPLTAARPSSTPPAPS